MRELVQPLADTTSSHYRTATEILTAVQNALSAHGASHVTTVGHSLGNYKILAA